MNYEALDEALEYLNEGIFDPSNKALLNKFEKAINKFSKKQPTKFNAYYGTSNIDALKEKLSKANLSVDEKSRYKELCDRFDEARKNLTKAYAIKEITKAKTHWDTGKGDGCFEGDNIEALYLLGISQADIVKHFAKIESNLPHTVNYFISLMCGDDDEYSKIIAKKVEKVVPLNSKAVEIYSNDDDIMFLVPKSGKFIDIYTDDSIAVVSDIYKKNKGYLGYYLEDKECERIAKSAYIETAKENHIEFKI